MLLYVNMMKSNKHLILILGIFFFPFSTHIIASCEMDLHDFPMDTQQCKLSFGSCEYLFFLILFVVVCFFCSIHSLFSGQILRPDERLTLARQPYNLL